MTHNTKKKAVIQNESNLWGRLKVGDQVRLVHMPSEFSRPDCFIHRDTLRAYRRVIARVWPQRIFKIDAWGTPWISVRFRMKNGQCESHELAVNHDGLVQVGARTGTRRVRKRGTHANRTGKG